MQGLEGYPCMPPCCHATVPRHHVIPTYLSRVSDGCMDTLVRGWRVALVPSWPQGRGVLSLSGHRSSGRRAPRGALSHRGWAHPLARGVKPWGVGRRHGGGNGEGSANRTGWAHGGPFTKAGRFLGPFVWDKNIFSAFFSWAGVHGLHYRFFFNQALSLSAYRPYA